LGNRKGIRPVKKLSGEVLAWLSVWSKVQNDLHMVQPMPPPPIASYSSKIQNGLPFWCQLTEVVLEKRPLNGCSSSFQVNLPGIAGPAESLSFTSFCLEDDVIVAMPANSVPVNFTVNIVGTCKSFFCVRIES